MTNPGEGGNKVYSSAKKLWTNGFREFLVIVGYSKEQGLTHWQAIIWTNDG